MAGSGNLVSGNIGEGVAIESPKTKDNVVLGNFIGTDLAGSAPVANAIGVLVSTGASTNMIGGTDPLGRATWFPAIAASGIVIRDQGTSANVVLGQLHRH